MTAGPIESYIEALQGPILVTGASGFVGANLFSMLAEHRNDVFAVVRHDKGWRLADVKDESIIAVDLTDHAAMKNMVTTVAPQTVFDCVAYGAYSFEKTTELIVQTNFPGRCRIWWACCRSRSFAAYVHAGSSSEYGTNCTAPPRAAVCEPNSAYAVSKVAVANYLQFVGQLPFFPVVNLRLYSVYGPLEDTSPGCCPRLTQQGDRTDRCRRWSMRERRATSSTWTTFVRRSS